jgi:hypothetical protein
MDGADTLRQLVEQSRGAQEGADEFALLQRCLAKFKAFRDALSPEENEAMRCCIAVGVLEGVPNAMLLDELERRGATVLYRDGGDEDDDDDETAEEDMA